MLYFPSNYFFYYNIMPNQNIKHDNNDPPYGDIDVPLPPDMNLATNE